MLSVGVVLCHTAKQRVHHSHAHHLRRAAAQVNYDPSIHFDDPRLLQHLRAGGAKAALIHEFLVLLSVCHTVIPEVDGETGAVSDETTPPEHAALTSHPLCVPAHRSRIVHRHRTRRRW